MNNITVRLRMTCKCCGERNGHDAMFSIETLASIQDGITVYDMPVEQMQCAKCRGKLEVNRVQLVHEVIDFSKGGILPS